MRIRDHPGTAAVILLAGAAALHGLLGVARSWPGGDIVVAPVQQTLPAPGTKARRLLEWCRENVAIIHDVYWASACAAAGGDDSPDCTLSDERARPLNAARAKAEQQCLADALASVGGTPGP